MPARQLSSLEVGEVAQWLYPKRVKTKKGSWAVYVTDAAGKELRIQLNTHHGPKCTIPFGITSWDDDPNKTRKNMEISLPSDQLTQFFTEIDENNITQGVDNSEEWFKQKLTRDEVAAKYKRLVQQPDEKWNPNVRTKVNLNSGRHPLFVYSINRNNGREYWERTTYDKVVKGSRAAVIVKISALWFMNGQFGMTVETTDILMYPTDTRGDFDFNMGLDGPTKKPEEEQLPEQSVLFLDSEESPSKKRKIVNDMS